MIQGFWKSALLIGLTLAPAFAFSDTQNQDDSSDVQLLDFSTGAQANQFYSLDENQRTRDQVYWMQPQQVMQVVQTEFESLATKALSLLRWIRHDEPLAEPHIPYNRLRHFGTWVAGDGECYNTRAQVLIRESQGPVRFRQNNRCIVESGNWHDPYTGNTFTIANDLDIDHVVPLKHAYMTGAANWDAKHRCLYANFINNTYHLKAVYKIENRKKGDKSPDQYQPPNNSEICEYLEDWLKIKLTWKLVMLPEEVQAITRALKQNQCSPDALKMSRTELNDQREAMDQFGACAGFGD